MRAIVTGGCGFIGYNLCLALHKAKWEMLVVDDISSGKSHNKIDGVEYVEEKIETPGLLHDIIGNWGPTTIFHLAAIPRVSYSVENPLQTTMANVIGTVALLEAVRLNNTKIRVVNTGSSSVYGGADNLPTNEDEPTKPQSPYAMQKLQSEQWCKMYANLYDMDVLTLRYFNAFGAHSYYGGAYSTVLSAWLYALYVDPDSKPFLEGDGTQSRDFCYIDNIVQANMNAAADRTNPAANPKFHGGSYNIAQGSAHTLLECKELLESISGKKLDLEMRPPRVGDVDHTLADLNKARDVLEYEPETDFEGQVKKMADWYRDGYVK